MKNLLKLLLFSALYFTVCSASAQTKTLSFNQVLLVGSNVQTVPSGKVWKVEGTAGPLSYQYRYASQSNSDYNPPQNTILINGSSVTVVQAVGTGAGASYGGGSIYTGFAYAGSPTSFPLWLPEGTTLAAGVNVTHISVIEFNVDVTP